MEEIDILIKNIENRNYHKQIKTETSKFTHRLKYWFYDLLVDHTNLIMISILCLFSLLTFGSLAIGYMISDDIFITLASGIPLGYALICSSMSKLIIFARQLRDEVS